MNVSLTPELDRYVQSKVETGRYNSASEVLREALRLMQEKDEIRAVQLREMRAQIENGSRQGSVARAARDAKRQARLEALASTEPSRADAVFGAFADVPGFEESIQAVIARRAERYGFAE